MRLLAALLLPSATLAARVLLSAGEDGIGARRMAFTSHTGREPPEPPDVAELPSVWRRKLQVAGRMAHGAFGTVYKIKVTCGNSSGAEVAMKVMHASRSAKKEAEALREMKGVSDYCSSSVGKPDHVLSQGYDYVLMPFMNQGDLHDLISRCFRTPSCRCQGPGKASSAHPGLCWEALGPPFSEASVLALVLQAMKGVRALHRRHLVHMDLKPENVMVHCEGLSCYAQVIDLGLVCREHHACGMRGSYGYMAPEVWRGTDAGIPANDVFSLGAVLYLLELASLPPFTRDMDGSMTMAYRPQEDPKLSARPAERPMVRLIRRMLDPNPMKRISLKNAESRLQAIILNKSSSEAIRAMIEKSPATRGAKARLPDCIDEGSGAAKVVKMERLAVLLVLWAALSL